MGYIYKITNLVNNKIYIGQTKNLTKYRWQHHIWKANHPEKEDTNYPLYRAMRKYGVINFSFEEIEQTDDELLNQRERYWIQKLQTYAPNGYNCDLGGAGVSKFNHKEILNYFLNEGQHNATRTANYFKCSLVTVLKILENNNLKGNGQCQPVYQIDRNTGEIINQFQSLKEVEKELGLHKTQIWSAVNSQAKTAGGYCWCKIQDINNFNLQQHTDNKQTKVICKENGKIFNSFADAARWLKEKGYSNNPSRSNLSKVCDIPNRTAYKFHWLTFDN